jgi:hypothetical protein
MSAGSILTISVLATTLGARAARACDPVPATARLGLGVCALESVPEGVRTRSCADGASWTIDATPAATVVEGSEGWGLLDGATVDVMLSDGASLWMGLSESRGGRVRPRGLVRYDLAHGEVHAFRGTDTGPCGFHVHDLLLRDDTLWVATDLGVSRRRLSPEDWDEWTHYALSTDGAGMEETACSSLLAVVAEAAVAPGGEELGGWLAEFRPKFVKRSRRGVRPAGLKRQEAE